jgi:hypothetical protein
VVAAKKEKKEKEPKPKAEPKKAEPKKEAAKPAAVVDAEADGLDMMEEKKKDPLDLLPKGSFDLEEWKRFYSNNDEEASCAWFWQHFDPQHYSIWRGEYRSGDQLLSKTLLATFFFILNYSLSKPNWLLSGSNFFSSMRSRIQALLSH